MATYEICETYHANGIKARGRGVFIEPMPDGLYSLRVQAGSQHGRRYFIEATYESALAHAYRWQRRRLPAACH